ncbi:MAG: chromate resistance protein [Gemmatimonadetes bacterium]|nr:chromate resistance protein [Gemmatimonadota bacterium]
MNATPTRWLLLIHQIPPKPGYFRVKVRRRLTRLGAVAIKNSVYVLPVSEQAREDFEWVLREITDGGGEASIAEVSFVGGLSDDAVEALFRSARDVDYARIAQEAQSLASSLPPVERGPDEIRADAQGAATRLRRRLGAVVARDQFGAAGRKAAEEAVERLEELVRGSLARETAAGVVIQGLAELRGRVWVTRRDVHVDRMASAWLIRRFVDPQARFKFVAAQGYHPGRGEVRFDMFEAEFTHEGDRCTFEVLVNRLGLDDPALRAIAEIVHDIDLKDSKFGRRDAAGVERLVSGIRAAHRTDDARLERAAMLLDDLCAAYRQETEPGESVGDGGQRAPRPRIEIAS